MGIESLFILGIYEIVCIVECTKMYDVSNIGCAYMSLSLGMR